MSFVLALASGVRLIDDGAADTQPLVADRVCRACAEHKPTVVSLAVVLLQQLA